MHLSYIIAVLASVSTTVQAISESQQLEPLAVVTLNAAQSVESTASDPRVSKRSLRVQKQEEDKPDGEFSNADFASTEENRDLAAVWSFVGTRFGGYLPSSVGGVKTAVQPQTVAMSSKLNRIPEALVAEPQSLQHIIKKAPELDLVNPQQARGQQQSMKETIKVPKDALQLSTDRDALLKPYTNLVTEYSENFRREGWTAAQFQRVWEQDFQKTRALIDPDVLYSLLYRGRMLDDLEGIDAPVVERIFKDRLNKIVNDPIALKKFGRVMQETEDLNEASLNTRRVSGKPSREKDAVNFLIDFRGAFNRALLLHGDRLAQAVKQKWSLTRTKKALGITDDTPLDDVAYTELRNIIAARLVEDKVKNGGTSAVKNEAAEVVEALIQHPLARMYLSHALEKEPSEVFKTLLGAEKPGLDLKDLEEVLHSSVVLKRFRDLDLDM
uniref:RxLR effector protein n=1 Tax=Peronospora matthiolae TaxID=2874970 RepID=A0AAV1T900_9STRA